MQESFSPQDSLALIQSMISKTKNNLAENRIYFLLWGWVALVGILGQFVLKVFVEYRHHYLSWVLVIPAIIITNVYNYRRSRRATTKTYIGEAMGNLWMGMAVSFFVLSFIFTFLSHPYTGWAIAYPFFILLYGLGTFVSGRILQFRPFVVGGIFDWLLAGASVFFPFDYQLLFAAAAIISSYLVPAYLLSSKQS
jgi:hypothetical protein